MANDASIGKHTLQQVQRLERNLTRLSGGNFKLPNHNRYGKEFLLIDQLKAVNICLEGLLGDGGVVEATDDLPELPSENAEPEMQPTNTTEESEAPVVDEPQSPLDYQSMNVPQLKKSAKERGLLSAELNTKVLLIEALEMADKAAEQVNANGEE